MSSWDMLLWCWMHKHDCGETIIHDVVGESQEEISQANSSLHVKRLLDVWSGADSRVQGRHRDQLEHFVGLVYDWLHYMSVSDGAN